VTKPDIGWLGLNVPGRRHEAPADFVAEAERIDEPRDIGDGAFSREFRIAPAYLEAVPFDVANGCLEGSWSGDGPAEIRKVVAFTRVDIDGARAASSTRSRTVPSAPGSATSAPRIDVANSGHAAALGEAIPM
jgi:hypothetical protein